MAVAIGSFPIERWAEEVKDLLRARGVDSDVAYAGPRAYEVLVSDEDGDRAGEIVDSVGYLSCPVAGDSASMNGVLEWRDPEAEEEDDLHGEINKIAATELEAFANAEAARAWSTPGDEISGKYEDVIVVAEFGDIIGVNGDIKANYPVIPAGYEEVSEGGRVPTTESHVGAGAVVTRTWARVRDKYPRLRIKAEDIEKILEREILKGWEHEIPVSVSGDVTVYAKKKIVREKEDLGRYVGKIIFPGIVHEWYYNGDSKKAYKAHFDNQETIVLEYDVSDLELDPEHITPSGLNKRVGVPIRVEVKGLTK